MGLRDTVAADWNAISGNPPYGGSRRARGRNAMVMSRRQMVAGIGALAVPFAPSAPRPPGAEPPAPDPLVVPAGVAPEKLARDEGFWRSVARRFRVSPDFVNLENGYYGIMPEPVRREYHRNVDHLNEWNSHLLRMTYKPRADEIRQRVASVLGAAKEEIALTRGGTEALQNLIAGYRRLRPGDSVMYADLDYHSMQYAMNWLADRRGVRDIPNMEILTPEEPPMYGTITAFRITGRVSEADNVAITDYLLDRHRVFTVRRGGPVRGDCVRVTPALFTSRDDVDLLALALHDVARRFTA